MATIKVLIQGYAKKLPNGFVASSTTCLIESGGRKILTDPGCNREKLFEALTKEGLRTGDIDYVFLSHQHPDHIMLAGLFERAKHVTFDTNLIYDKDVMVSFEKDVLGKDIEVIETPGHVLEHLSLLVDTPEGKVAVAGDVVWWLDDEKQVFDIDQPDHSEAKGMDMKALMKSRKKLTARADYIIPGHGKMFKVAR